MHIKSFAILSFALLLSAVVYAQGTVESPYSRYGIGDVNASLLTRNAAMGGVGYATTYLGDANYKNPAALADIDSMTFIFNFGMDAGLRNYSIANPQTSKLKSDVELSQILLGFSCAKWWKSMIGVMPYSNVGYSIYSADNSLDIDKNLVFAGDGGLNKVVWANGFKLIKNLNFGFSASYLFGKIYHSNAIVFDDDSTGTYVNGFNQKTFKISDFTFDAGLKYNFPIKNDVLSVGLYYAYNSKLNSKLSTLVYNTLATSSTTIIDTVYKDSNVKGTIGLPSTVGFGLGYTINSKLMFAADFTLQNWKNSKFFGECDSLNNSFSTAIGAEYTPNKFAPRDIWQASSYRMGLYFNNSYINMNNSQFAVPDYGISFGMGIPLKYSKTAFNVSLQLGQRGSILNNMVKETYFIVGINLNLVDTWFVKSKID